MALLKIARLGHPVLIRPAAPVDDPTDAEIRRLIADMIDTMKDAQGVGLAGPQVYQSRRVIVFEAPAERAGAGEEPGPALAEAGGVAGVPLTALINPSFEPIGEALDLGLEGCLSIPGLSGVVPRFARIRYRGVTQDGETVAREASGFHARVVQHEIDHLDGVLYPMRMTDLTLLAFNEEVGRMLAALDEIDGEDG